MEKNVGKKEGDGSQPVLLSTVGEEARNIGKMVNRATRRKQF